MSNTDKKLNSDFTIDEFHIYPSKNLIVEQANQIHITPKVLAVLIVLAEKQGDTLSKEEIIKMVWGDIAISDMVLSKAISDLRKAFGDTAKKQEFIQTVSKKGYILVKEVKWGRSESDVKVEANKGYLGLGNIVSLLLMVSFVILIFIISNKNEESDSDYSKAPTISNITADTGEQRHPRFSPDGQFIAYFEYSENNQDKLILQEIVSGAKKQLKIFTQASKVGPSKGVSFSGNGMKLAVRVNREEGCQILIIDLSSMIEKELNDCPFSTIASIDFSPDGNSIITTEFNTGLRTVNLVEIELIDEEKKLAGKEMEEFGGYLFPRFNRAGTKLASIGLIAATSSWSIEVTDLKTGRHQTVYQSERQLNQVVWGEDDQILYFVSHQGTAPGIWKVALDSLAVTRIFNDSHEISDLDYSVTTGNFVYSESQYNYSIIQKFQDNNGEYVDSPLRLATKNNILPVISPDNRFLAYVSRDFGPDRLFVYSIDENENKLVFSGAPGRIIDIGWSPDSKEMMATQINGDSSGIVLINLRTGAIANIGSGNKIARGRWSSDGKQKFWISFGGKQWSLIRLDEDNKESKMAELGLISDYEVIENDQIIIRTPGFNSNNKLIRLAQSSELENKVKEKILITNSSLGDWDVSGNKVYYILKESKSGTLNSVDFNGGSSMKIATIDGEIYNVSSQLSVSRDQKKIYLVVKDKVGTDLFLVSKE